MLLRYCRIDHLCMGPNIIQDAFHELVQLRRVPAVFANVLQRINRNVHVMACCLFYSQGEQLGVILQCPFAIMTLGEQSPATRHDVCKVVLRL